jgi:hypothetical protein
MRLFLTAALATAFYSAFQRRLRNAHPRQFNVLRRASDLLCVCIGMYVVIAGILWMVRPGTLPGDPSIPMWERAAITALCVLIPAIGVRGLRLPTYRPDLGDTAEVIRADPSSEESKNRWERNWWTGEPRSRSGNG